MEIQFVIDIHEDVHLDFAYGTVIPSGSCPINRTISFWKEWASDPAIGLIKETNSLDRLINRSLITLKLITYDPSGAFAASATNGLPEIIGGKKTGITVTVGYEIVHLP